MSERDGLERKLKFGTPEARKAAAMSLGRLRDPKSIPALLESMKTDDYALTRVFAIQALTWIAERSVIKHIIDIAMKDKSVLVRKTAIESLGTFKDTMALKPLYRIVNTDKNIEIIRVASISIQVILGIAPQSSLDITRA
ncbi:MAG: HEAT repeat domain-containing protein [Candidatus Kariarchaeaceae archaeon]|jgi:HEAT repeat protein